MSAISLKGIFPPIPTPFINGEVAHEQLTENIQKWCKTGISGIVVFGSNGEYPYLSVEEKLKTIDTAVKAVDGSLPIIVGSGCESTKGSIELTNQCAALGASAALMVTPFYYKGGMTSDAMNQHFTNVASQSKVPIILYNVTKFTGINLSAKLVGELSSHQNIIGIKDSSGNVSQLGEYLNAADKNFEVMVGTAGALFGALTLGCSGGVLAAANVAPEICVEIFKSIQTANFKKAQKLQRRILSLNTALTATYGVPGLKAALDMLGYFGGEPRLPLLPLAEKECREIKQILIDADLL